MLLISSDFCVDLNEVEVRAVPVQVSHSSSLSVPLGFLVLNFISEEMQFY